MPGRFGLHASPGRISRAIRERARLSGSSIALCRQCGGHHRGARRNRGNRLDPSGADRGACPRAADARSRAAPRPLAGEPMSADLDGELREGRHTMPVRVYYEDTDFTGIVYHANYLRYMERGRTNYLRLIGADHRALFEATEKEAPGFAFVVRTMTIDWLKPARMDDVLDIRTAPEEVKGASITLLQQCWRSEELLCEAHVRVAFISQGRARPIPKPLRIAMKADQQRLPPP